MDYEKEEFKKLISRLKERKKGVIIYLIICLLTAFLAGWCHVNLNSPSLEGNISVECVRKVEGLSSGGYGFPVSKIYFSVTNNSKKELASLEGVARISRRSDNKILLTKNVTVTGFSSLRLAPNQSEEFYLFLYDIKNDNGGIENFDDIYYADISDLVIVFDISEAQPYQYQNTGVRTLGFLLQLPTISLAFLCFGLFLVITRVFIIPFVMDVENIPLKVILFIVLSPLFLVALLAGGCRKQKNRKTLNDVLSDE